METTLRNDDTNLSCRMENRIGSKLPSPALAPGASVVFRSHRPKGGTCTVRKYGVSLWESVPASAELTKLDSYFLPVKIKTFFDPRWFQSHLNTKLPCSKLALRILARYT
jgi:hypothetical protein